MKNTFVNTLLEKLGHWKTFARQTTSIDEYGILIKFSEIGHRKEIQDAYIAGKKNATEEDNVSEIEYYNKTYLE